MPKPPPRAQAHARAPAMAAAIVISLGLLLLAALLAGGPAASTAGAVLGGASSRKTSAGVTATASAPTATMLAGGPAVPVLSEVEEGEGAARASAQTAPTVKNPNPLAAGPPPAGCTSPRSFLRYQPSPWEVEWAGKVASLAAANASACAAARADGDRAARMLAWTVARTFPSSPAPDWGLASALVYTCTTPDGTAATWAEPIEPLVGLLRHPWAVPACAPPGGVPVHIEDRSYLILGGGRDDAARATATPRPSSPTSPTRPSSPLTPASSPLTPASALATSAHARHNNKSWLFDAGANAYNTSLAWLVGRYAARGVLFDAIYAWEAALPLDAAWWAAVPPTIAPRLHAINAPVGVGTAMDPLAWMESLAGPGDRVVFKLDVGSQQTERAFVDGIAGDAARWRSAPYELEFFYEFHFGDPALAPWFGVSHRPDTPGLADAMGVLARMRAAGVRAHYWP